SPRPEDVVEECGSGAVALQARVAKTAAVVERDSSVHIAVAQLQFYRMRAGLVVGDRHLQAIGPVRNAVDRHDLLAADQAGLEGGTVPHRGRDLSARRD